jgi:hypothetical protein
MIDYSVGRLILTKNIGNTLEVGLTDAVDITEEYKKVEGNGMFVCNCWIFVCF